jgi:hypothetical protein
MEDVRKLSKKIRRFFIALSVIVTFVKYVLIIPSRRAKIEKKNTFIHLNQFT